MKFFLGIEGEPPASGYLQKIQQKMESQLKPLENCKYGECLKSIGIITILVSEKYYDSFSERILFQRKQKSADIRIRMNYKSFLRADEKQREEMYKAHLIESIKSIEERVCRVEKNFAFDKLLFDVNDVLRK